MPFDEIMINNVFFAMFNDFENVKGSDLSTSQNDDEIR